MDTDKKKNGQRKWHDSGKGQTRTEKVVRLWQRTDKDRESCTTLAKDRQGQRKLYDSGKGQTRTEKVGGLAKDRQGQRKLEDSGKGQKRTEKVVRLWPRATFRSGKTQRTVEQNRSDSD